MKAGAAAVAKGLAVILLFLVSFVAGALLHLDAAKKPLIAFVNKTLDKSLAGRIEIHEVAQLGAGEIEGLDATIHAPDGERVMLVQDASAEIEVLPLIRSLGDRDAPLLVRLPQLQVSSAEVDLTTTPDGELALAQAFQPTGPETPSKGPGLKLTLDDVVLERVWVHGALASGRLDGSLHQVHGQLQVDDEGTHIDIEDSRLVVRRIPGPSLPRLTASLSGKMGIASGEPEKASAPPLKAQAELRGHLGQIPISVEGSFEQGAIYASLRVEHASPAALREAGLPLELRHPLSATLSAEGNLEQALSVELGLRSGGARASVDAKLIMAPQLRVDADLAVQDFSPRLLAADAPAASINAHGSTQLSFPDAGPTGAFRLETEPFSLDGTPVMAIRANGELSPERIQGTAKLEERGAPSTLTYTVTLPDEQRSAPLVEVALSSRIGQLSSWSRLAGAPLSGSAQVEVDARLDLATQQLDGHFNVTAQQLSGPSFEAQRLSAKGSLRGSTETPRLDAEVRLRQLQLWRYVFSRGVVRAQGPLSRLRVNAEFSGGDGPLRAEAVVRTSPQLAVRHADARWTRAGQDITLQAEAITFGPGGVRTKGVEIGGIGKVRVSGGLRGDELDLHVSGKDVKLPRIAALLGQPKLVPSGEGDIELDLRGRPTQLTGSIKADFKDVAVGPVQQAKLKVDAQLDSGVATGEAMIVMGQAAYVIVNAQDFEVPQRLEPRALKGLSGRLRLDAGMALEPAGKLLAQVAPQLAKSLPTSGFIGLAARVDASAEREPELQLSAYSRELVLHKDSALAGVLSGHDAQLHASLTPERRLAAIVELSEQNRLVATSTLAITLPPEVFNPGGAKLGLKSFHDSPAKMRLMVPSTDVASLPPSIKPFGIDGRVSLDARFNGTLRNPDVRAQARLLRPTREQGSVFGDEFTVRLDYDGSQGELDATALREGQRIARVNAKVQGSVHRALLQEPSSLSWHASARADFEGFELAQVEWLANRGVTGVLRGKLELNGLHRDPKVSANLRVDELKLGQIHYNTARLEANLDERRGEITAALKRDGDGLEAEAKSQIRWKNGWLPELAPEGSQSARIELKRFELMSLLPFVKGTVTRLEGHLDGQLRVSDSSGSRPTYSGEMKLREGVIQLPAIGQQFRDIRADIDLSPRGVLEVSKVSARGITGRVRASATAHLDGLSLKRAEARVRVKDDEAIPLTVQGVSMGEFSGRVEVDASPSDKGSDYFKIGVKIPKATLRLPEVAAHQVQALETPDFIETGVFTKSGEFEPLRFKPPEEPESEGGMIPIIELELGKVFVTRGIQLKVRLTGDLRLVMEQEARASGRIQLPGGHLEVIGKRFEIEQGHINFNDVEPSNPLVVVTAVWESPQGYRVFAEFRGPIESGELSLRSDPPLPESDVLSLLLLGTTGGTVGADQGDDEGGSTAGAAATVVGQQATAGLTRAISDLTNLEVTTRISTEESSSPRPEVAVQLSPRVRASLSYALGEPGLGESPDRAALRVEYLLKKHWSIATSIGDRGSSELDLMWRYRY